MVLGTRGRTGISKFLLGSAAEEIFRRSPCAVLTVGPKSPAQPSRAEEFSQILYATDFTPESMAGAPYALSLAQEYQASWVVVLKSDADLHRIGYRLGEAYTMPFGERSSEQRTD